MLPVQRVEFWGLAPICGSCFGLLGSGSMRKYKGSYKGAYPKLYTPETFRKLKLGLGLRI